MRAQVFKYSSTTIQQYTEYSIQYTTVQCNSESLQLRANTQMIVDDFLIWDRTKISRIFIH